MPTISLGPQEFQQLFWLVSISIGFLAVLVAYAAYRVNKSARDLAHDRSRWDSWLKVDMQYGRDRTVLEMYGVPTELSDSKVAALSYLVTITNIYCSLYSGGWWGWRRFRNDLWRNRIVLACILDTSAGIEAWENVKRYKMNAIPEFIQIVDEYIEGRPRSLAPAGSGTALNVEQLTQGAPLRTNGPEPVVEPPVGGPGHETPLRGVNMSGADKGGG